MSRAYCVPVRRLPTKSTLCPEQFPSINPVLSPPQRVLLPGACSHLHQGPFALAQIRQACALANDTRPHLPLQPNENAPHFNSTHSTHSTHSLQALLAQRVQPSRDFRSVLPVSLQPSLADQPSYAASAYPASSIYPLQVDMLIRPAHRHT
ncbi:hypothetical protein PMIN01_09329 [Paraphaeosphaeria minitans]|uniref:Uncharacterized protein n=1 Tax=Paraphaeosphaeria minitans TaxID=565426 RepID=A0A9P6GB81_9PLEO|nr:hypothetical protein PMIN01_09329 [Paraphaeosphaeria minitans]